MTPEEKKKRPNIRSLDDPRMQQLGQILQQLAAQNAAEQLVGTRTDILQAFKDAGIDIDKETLQNWLVHYRKLSGGRLQLRDRRGPYVLRETPPATHVP